MSRIISSKRTCAVCGKEHVFNVVISTSSFGSMDLDTRPPRMKRDTLKYEIQMCDHCLYSNSDIETLFPNFDAEMLKTPEYIEVANNSEIDATAKAFFLAGLLQAYHENYRDAGIYFLNAAWIFDDLNEHDFAVLARRQSHEFLSMFVEETEDVNLAVLTVDLQRRVGDFNDAIETAEQLIEYGVDEFLEKILKLEIKLCTNADASCHNVGEVE